MAAIGLVLLASAGQHASYFPQIFFAFLLWERAPGSRSCRCCRSACRRSPTRTPDWARRGQRLPADGRRHRAGFLSTIAANRTKSLVASGHDIHSLTLGYQLALYIAAACVLLGLLISPLLLHTSESPEEQRRHIARTCRIPRPRNTSSSRAETAQPAMVLAIASVWLRVRCPLHARRICEGRAHHADNSGHRLVLFGEPSELDPDSDDPPGDRCCRIPDRAFNPCLDGAPQAGTSTERSRPTNSEGRRVLKRHSKSKDRYVDHAQQSRHPAAESPSMRHSPRQPAGWRGSRRR